MAAGTRPEYEPYADSRQLGVVAIRHACLWGLGVHAVLVVLFFALGVNILAW